MKAKKKEKIILIAVCAVIVAAGFFYGGLRYGISSVKPGVAVSSDTSLDADFSLFWEAVDLVKERYVNISDVKDQNLLYGAIKGVLGALDDPYSVFFNPSDAKKLNQDLSGSFGGIVAQIDVKNDQLVVITPLKGTPAEAAGLKAGDKILKIDDKFTDGVVLEEAVKLIRGEPGTEVELLILRNGWEEAKEFKIKRAIIEVPTLDWDMKEVSGKYKVAHIRLYNFNANAPQLFYEAAFSALLKGAHGIVLDLRNNPGGFLEVATDISSWFLKRGEIIVREQFSPGNYKDFRATGNSALVNVPVVILVNGGSASASEILAGALRDSRGAKVVGEKTFGKGTVQEVESLKDGSSVKISVAKWITPSGVEIDKKGIEPDYEVKISEEDAEEGKDVQLDKALEVLEPEMAKAGPSLVIIPVAD